MATAKLFGKFLMKALNKEIDFDSDTFMVLLTPDTPDQDAWDYKDDVTGELGTANGYTAGGVTLGSITIGYTDGTNIIKLNGAAVQWPAATFGPFRYAIIYDDTPATAATKPLVGYVDYGSAVTALGGAVDLVWDASGIATITVS